MPISVDALREDASLRRLGLVITDILGEGGSSVVYRARDARHHRDVAIKVLRDDASAVLTKRFAREIRVAARLRHPHILPLFDSGVLEDGRAFAVMPVAQGRPLRAMIDEGPLTVNDAVRIAREVTEALAYLHSQGYVHRDVKPENIIIESGHAVLSDFGLAAHSSHEGPASQRNADWWIQSSSEGRHTDAGIAVGTLAYMSPEALLGYDTIDVRSDIFSVGYVLYEMLAGTLPSQSTVPLELFAKRSSAPLPALGGVRADISPQLDAVIAKCTAALPTDRYGSAAELGQALAALPHATSAPSHTVPRRDSAWGSLRIAALLVSVAALPWMWHRLNRSQELDPSRVVVGDLAADVSDSSGVRLGVLGGDVIARVLADSTALTVVNATVSVPASSSQRLPGADSVLANRTRKMVLAARAGLVVTGSIVRTGTTRECIAEVTDARSGRVLGVVGPIPLAEAQPDQAFLSLANQVLAVIRRRYVPPDA